MTAAFAALNSHGHLEATVRVCRDLGRPNSFYAVATTGRMFRFRPSIAGGYATEDIDVFKAARRTFASEERAAAAAMASVARRQKLRWARLVRWLEFGPYECPGDSPWYFTAGIYKALRGPPSFFPVLRAREPHKADKKPAGTNLIVDVRTSLARPDPEEQTYRTAKALEATLTKAFTRFAPPNRNQVSKFTLTRTVELRPRGASDPTFVVKFYEAAGRRAHFYSIFRRSRRDLTTAFTYKPTSAIIETLKFALTPKRATSASPSAALKAAIAAIEKL